jgi:SagB-type dehydrogenase family enzyme
MKNREIEAAWAYHNGTKHSYESIRASSHFLDWENQPLSFKLYPKLEPISLPQHLSSSGMPALSAMASPGATLGQVSPLTSQRLAEILFLSAGVTRRRSHFGGEILFRAAACTGALYHIDLYLVCGDLEDVAAGVYQFGPQDFALRRLRAGDYRSALVKASGDETALADAPCVVISASTFWRNAWKYQARAYRHCFWDNGTILANLFAAAAARMIPAKLILGFVDGTVSRLLALDGYREAPLSMVALGHSSAGKRGVSLPVAPLAVETAPLSKTEVDYPGIRAMHEASSLDSEEGVRAWRETGTRKPEVGRTDPQAVDSQRFPLQLLSEADLPADTIEEVIMRRGSTREFAREPISFTELSAILDRATRNMDVDFLDDPGDPLNEIYLIVHAVEGLPAGAYVFRRQERELELLKAGDFRREAGHLGLGQEIPADCSVNVYFLADLKQVLERFGNRGYRAAQLDAAIMGGKTYLAAYAQSLGASGLTFFDNDVTEFFSPHAAGKSVMFLVALGKSLKRFRATS